MPNLDLTPSSTPNVVPRWSPEMSGRFPKGNTVNAKGIARHPIKRSRTDAGAPVPTPCSPRARRFRRARPLSCTPYRAGASDTATPAGIPAENAMQTDDTTQPMQPQPSEVAPASPPPPINRFCLGCLTPSARSAATAPGGRPLVRPALPLRCSTRPPRPRSRLHRRSRSCILPPLAHNATGNSRFSTQPLSAVL